MKLEWKLYFVMILVTAVALTLYVTNVISVGLYVTIAATASFTWMYWIMIRNIEYTIEQLSIATGIDLSFVLQYYK